MTARLTAGQHHEIATRHEAGESQASLARAFGCSISNINMVCLTLGAVSPKARPVAVIALGPARIERDGRVVRRFMPDEDARITGMEAAGLGDRAIGLALGRDEGSIRMRRKTLARHASRIEEAEARPFNDRRGLLVRPAPAPGTGGA